MSSRRGRGSHFANKDPEKRAAKRAAQREARARGSKTNPRQNCTSSLNQTGAADAR